MRRGVGFRALGACAAVSVAVIASGSLVGCTATYANYPAIGDDAAVNDPNSAPMPEVIERALVRVLRDSPPSTNFVINLPQGLERGKAEALRDALGDDRAELAALSVSGLPTYHVQKVWIRGNRGRVEILAPIAGAEESYDIVTVRLAARGFSNWRVQDVRRWPGDDVTAPPLYGWPTVSRNDDRD